MDGARSISRRRRAAASVALAAAGAGLAYPALTLADSGVDWPLLAMAGLVAAAGVGLSRTSIVPQVLARSVAWLVLVPTASALGFELLRGHRPEGLLAWLAACSASALLLARPALQTQEAHAQFGPVAFRRWLLASSTVSAAFGVLAGMASCAALVFGNLGVGVGAGALAAALTASSVGVLRMRAWGILLGLATATAALVAAVLPGTYAPALVWASLPGLMMGLPLLLRNVVGDGPGAAEARARIAAEIPRARVAAEVQTPATATWSEAEAADVADELEPQERRAALSP